MFFYRSLTQGRVCERSWAAECRYHPRQGRNSESIGSRFERNSDLNHQSTNGSNVGSSKHRSKLVRLRRFQGQSSISSWKCEVALRKLFVRYVTCKPGKFWTKRGSSGSGKDLFSTRF